MIRFLNTLPVATAFVLQGGAAERGAMASPLPKGSLCLHWLFKKMSPQIYYFFPNPLPFPEEMFWKAKDYSYLCIVSPRQASSQCSNRARRFLFMPPCAWTVLGPLPNGRIPRNIGFPLKIRKSLSAEEEGLDQRAQLLVGQVVRGFLCLMRCTFFSFLIR